MKKLRIIVTAVAVAALAFCLTGCAPRVPEGMSQEAYDLGQEALTCARDWEAGRIDDAEAADRLEGLSEQILDIEPYRGPDENVGITALTIAHGIEDEEDNIASDGADILQSLLESEVGISLPGSEATEEYLNSK